MADPSGEDESGRPAHRAVIKAIAGCPAGNSPFDRAWPVCLPEPPDRLKADEQQRHIIGPAAYGICQG